MIIYTEIYIYKDASLYPYLYNGVNFDIEVKYLQLVSSIFGYNVISKCTFINTFQKSFIET